MVISMERWKRKVAVVTGSSAGIGREIAKQLLENGVNVVGFARRIDKMQDLVGNYKNEPAKFYACKVDMKIEEDILNGFKWVVKNVGPVSILINNAGVGPYTSLTTSPSEKWKDVFDTNVLGLCIATSEAITIMNKHKIDGHIIHINSIFGHKVSPVPGIASYPASKFAVTALAETLRMELQQANSKIKVTSISPGLVDTDILKPYSFKNKPMLKVEELAETAIFVLSTPPSVLVRELTVAVLHDEL